jgi:hypothetical protein
MQSSMAVAGMDALSESCENILTRRANQRHYSIIAQFAKRPWPCPTTGPSSAENGTLLLVERMMPEAPGTSDEDRAHAMSDLNMLRGPGGLERTEQQYRHLLNECGFRPVAVHPAGRFSVIEARVL